MLSVCGSYFVIKQQDRLNLKKFKSYDVQLGVFVWYANSMSGWTVSKTFESFKCDIGGTDLVAWLIRHLMVVGIASLDVENKNLIRIPKKLKTNDLSGLAFELKTPIKLIF